MKFDATFWVAISFLMFIAILVYFKIPQKLNELLKKLSSEFKDPPERDP